MTALVYPVRPGDANEELRWSLRCAEKNLSFDEVWVVGYKPTWLQKVNFIPGNLWGFSNANVYNNIRLAAEHPDVPDEMLVMNDDFYVMRPVKDPFPMFYRGPLIAHLDSLRTRTDWWQRSLLETYVWLKSLGIEEPLSYELHLPFPAVKDRMAKVLAEAAEVQPENPPQWRTIYGNRWSVPALQVPDVKVNKRSRWPDGDLIALSTTDMSWRRPEVNHILKNVYGQKSRFERW